MPRESDLSPATKNCVSGGDESGTSRPKQVPHGHGVISGGLPNTVGARWASAADGGRGAERMLDAKLWHNPCWLAFRLNYLALRYNTPLYTWVQRAHGLSRVEYVVIYSLGLADGAQARDISETSGFPKNTLSRAIASLEERGLILRERKPGGGRNQPLRLSSTGWALFDETMPIFRRFEQMMLGALTLTEQETLSQLLAKVVCAADGWPESLNDPLQETSQDQDGRTHNQKSRGEVE